MTRKRRRLWLLLGGVVTLGVVTALVLFALRDNLNVFYSPSELKAEAVPAGRNVRIGGLVEKSSIVHEPDGRTIEFRVSDGRASVEVAFVGILPDLFREGQGVMVEGALDRGGMFRATDVLAKHDERYMPPEVAAALKKAGRWQEGGGAVPPKVSP